MAARRSVTSNPAANRLPPALRLASVILAATATAALVSGCQRQEAKKAEKLPVLVATQKAEIADYADTVSLTGVIAARTVNNLSFRVGGRVAERLVEVGDHVDKNQTLARIDPQEQESDLRTAQANLDAAQAQLTQTSATFDRQKTLLAQGYTTRRDYDQADQALKVAQGSVEAAKSALANAKENLSFTELRAGAPGIVTARTVEAGQVVQAAQTVFVVAEDGDRDAVFNVQETLVAGVHGSGPPPVAVALLADPKITAQGVVREISPVVDPASSSVRVKVGIPQTPAAMPLGAAVVGSVSGTHGQAVVLPWQALTSSDGKPAVWVVDPASKAVAIAPVSVLAYGTATVAIGEGLKAGQTVVTAGGQMLSPGLVVETMEAAR
ncbi:efflux RND transporter periplasmic adaptor subunit [Mesorhizobium sp. 1M-11]|uniref:efflux RND transporter periplasmic adaptor subunit n=1 Tax=Mesorhizobium sp. 1M-11 TaxID=1529006 RepID=UPI0006C737CE|nr:efflux RND transporter periplasmic adaptor subunit [Mesorhizobium sp. 1M-11]